MLYLLILFILLILLAFIIVNIIIQCRPTKHIFGGNSPNRHYSKKRSLRSESNVYASDSSESNVYASDSSESNVYAVTAVTYTISGEGNGLDYSILRKMFKDQESNGIAFIEKPVTEKVHISLGSFGGFSNKKSNKLNLSPEFYKQTASIKNVLDGHSGFINKTELYSTIKRLIPNGIKYIPATYTVKEFEKELISDTALLPYGLKIAILKKNFSCKQEGVKVIESKEDYFKAKKELDIKEDGIVSEYITNPLTIDGKKFHLRIYFLLSIVSGITRCTAHSEYRILTAKEKYKHGDWLNSDIHISGGHNTDKRYIFPDDIVDIDIDILLQNLADFNHTVCMALASSGVKNYSESNAGYQMYGADVLITKELTPILIEINKHPGYTQYGDTNGWEEFIHTFSMNFFHFILSHVIFPYLGLCKLEPPMAEFIGNGTLSPFGHILTGSHRCFIIPLPMSTKPNISTVEKMNFYGSISFNAVCAECAPINIFLISISTKQPLRSSETKQPLRSSETKQPLRSSETKQPLRSSETKQPLRSSETKQPLRSESDAYASGSKEDIIIGFIALTVDSNIKIAIMEEYQNRGIATAIIAQLMEMQCARYYTTHAPIVKIKQKNKFLSQIAVKLHFTYNNSKKQFERKCKINDPIIKKINNNQLLTYKIIEDDNISNDNTRANTLALQPHSDNTLALPHMTLSNSQFVHLLYSIFSDDRCNSKSSTGNKYNKAFIYQGAELKSSLVSNALKNIIVFKRYIYSSFASKQYSIFDSKIDKKTIPNDQNTLYNICDEYNNVKVIDGKMIQNVKENALFIEEYNPPFLIDEKLMLLRCRILIYVSGNNTVKYFIFHEKKTIIDDEIYDKMREHKFLLNNSANDASMPIKEQDLHNFMLELVKIIDMLKLRPYSESNAGFLIIVVDIKFIQKNSQYHPKLYNIWNYSVVTPRAITDITHYYNWIKDCVINPHFGFHISDLKRHDSDLKRHTSDLKRHNNNAIFCSIQDPISKELDSDIIIKLLLQFNQTRDSIDVLYSVDNKVSKIGIITLNLSHIIDNLIILDNIKLNLGNLENLNLDKMYLNVVFVLLDILGAYYAPNNPQFIMKCENYSFIAFELQFFKGVPLLELNDKKEYFMRKCR